MDELIRPESDIPKRMPVYLTCSAGYLASAIPHTLEAGAAAQPRSKNCFEDGLGSFADKMRRFPDFPFRPFVL
jgi:hypothetical protein